MTDERLSPAEIVLILGPRKSMGMHILLKEGTDPNNDVSIYAEKVRRALRTQAVLDGMRDSMRDRLLDALCTLESDRARAAAKREEASDPSLSQAHLDVVEGAFLLQELLR